MANERSEVLIEDGNAGNPEGMSLESDQSEAEAEASFAAGFAKESGHSDTLEVPEIEDGQSGDTASADALDTTAQEPGKDPAPEPEDEVDKLRRRQRKLEGQIGNQKQAYQRLQAKMEELTSSLENTGGDTAAEVGEKLERFEAGLKHIQEMESSIEEFVELKPFKAELEDIRQNIAAMSEQAAPSAGVSAEAIEERVQIGMRDYLYPDWKETIQQKDFHNFALKDGPSIDEYREFAASLSNPEAEIPPDVFQSSWQADYPKWWDDRGKLLFGNAADGIRLLDRYTDASEERATAEEQRERKRRSSQDRLRRNTMPVGSGADPSQGLSDDAAFERGFKRARGT